MQSRPVQQSTLFNIIAGGLVPPSLTLRQQVGSYMTGLGSDEAVIPIEICLSTMNSCKEMLTFLSTFISLATTNLSVMLPVEYVSALNKYSYMRTNPEGVLELHLEMSKSWDPVKYGSGFRNHVGRFNPAGIKKVAGLLVSCSSSEEVMGLTRTIRSARAANASDVTIGAKKKKKPNSNLVVIASNGAAVSSDGTIGRSVHVNPLEEYKAKNGLARRRK